MRDRNNQRNFARESKESTSEPMSGLNNIPWNRLTSQQTTSIRIVGKVALYSVVKPLQGIKKHSFSTFLQLYGVQQQRDRLFFLGKLLTKKQFLGMLKMFVGDLG